MSRRASQSEQTGTAGISEVMADFERLGWGPVENPRHDLGIDLFLQVRDERRYDTGLIVGAQVKSGPSYFAEPAHEDGELVGWWFRDDDREHIDSWLDHSLPVLIILRDLEARVSYWAHATRDAVLSTGKGAKILVPITNTVDADHGDELRAVAGAHQPAVQWEGSAWRTGSAIGLPDRLRNALAVPRLVAPHPNAPREEKLASEQAVAMLVQARLFDLQTQLGDPWGGEAFLEGVRRSDDWGWRFFAAMYDRAAKDKLDPLLECVRDAPRPDLAACAAVAAASALSESGRADEAVALLDATIARDDAAPVDHAWLHIQRARARAEIGDVDRAREDALVAQGARLAAPNDASASAVSGAAAILLFNTSRWGQRDVADVISGADTASSWWRAQVASRGLADVVEQTFRSWSRDQAVTFGGEDIAHNQLVSAGLASSHAGDHAGWRHHSSLDAKQALIRLPRHAEPERARDLLDQLRLAGDDKAMALAVPHLLRDGPASSIRLLAADLDLDAATNTTGLADLTLLKHGGDVLDREAADRLALWLLETYRLPSAFEKRTTPSYLLEMIVVEALAGVLPAAGPDTQEAVVAELVMLGSLDELEASAWVQVVYALRDDAWEPIATSRAAARARAHDDALRWPLLGVAARSDAWVREEILDGVRGGSLDALSAFGDVRQLPGDVARARIAGLTRAAERIVADANRGHHGFGSHDVASTLVLLNAWHPSEATWEPLIALLSSDKVAVSIKRNALGACARHLERVPQHVREAIVAPATLLADGTLAGFYDPFDPGDASGDATFLLAALGELGPGEVNDHFARLLAGDHNDRQAAARLAQRLPHAVGALAALTCDVDASVRATAAAGLVYAAGDDDTPQVVPVLRRCAEDPGMLVPAHVAAALSPGATSPIAEALRVPLTEQLSGHCSAQVRELARQSGALG
jgi:hypothetical protein